MTIESILFLILFSAICGVIGQVITGQPRGGLLATAAVGFLGALLGTWISAYLGMPALFTLRIGFFNFPVIWSLLGAGLLMSVVGMFTNRYYVYR
jgi:uncharacterized membrane protein YeaQ/YmgE (transglycosylase-associated protein family)